MQMQHYLQYRSNLLRGCLDEGRSVWTSLVKKNVGLRVGGVCVVYASVGGNVTLRADICMLMTSPGIWSSRDDFAAIKRGLFYTVVFSFVANVATKLACCADKRSLYAPNRFQSWLKFWEEDLISYFNLPPNSPFCTVTTANVTWIS